MAPILPGLSDRPEQLAEVVKAAREAGAAGIWANVLYLKPGTREHFLGLWRGTGRSNSGATSVCTSGVRISRRRRFSPSGLSSASSPASTTSAIAAARWGSGRRAGRSSSASRSRAWSDGGNTIPGRARGDHVPDRRRPRSRP